MLCTPPLDCRRSSCVAGSEVGIKCRETRTHASVPATSLAPHNRAWNPPTPHANPTNALGGCCGEQGLSRNWGCSWWVSRCVPTRLRLSRDLGARPGSNEGSFVSTRRVWSTPTTPPCLGERSNGELFRGDTCSSVHLSGPSGLLDGSQPRGSDPTPYC